MTSSSDDLHKKLLLKPPSFSSLCLLPEHGQLSLPIPSPTTPSSPPSLKNLLIFGPPTPKSNNNNNNNNNNDSWFPSKKPNFHRSRTAPAMSFPNRPTSSPHDLLGPTSPLIVKQSILLLSAFLIFGVTVFSLFPSHFSFSPTHSLADALYFCIVTMCTIGYGDITPSTPFSKLFSITFVLFAFGFLDILLSSMLSYVLDLQEALLLIHHHRRISDYLVDVKKGRMRIRIKVLLALLVVLVCVGVGTGVLAFVEGLGWLDSFYLSVMSVTTVGYGDRAFTTMGGRLFASVWLLVSTLAVARAFLYLAEARVDKRHREIAKRVLARDLTVSEFFAADMDNNGFVTKSEFVIYKLKEMGKVTEKDVMETCEQFERLDTGNCGKITLSDLIESHHH